jgi:peroxiredoxin
MPLVALMAMLFAGALVVLADQPEQKQKGRDAAAEPAAPATVPDEPAAAAPAPQAAVVTPEAKKLIEEVDAAYAALKRLELAGTFSADFDAAGQQRKESKTFTATFAAPNKFRHLMQDDILVGSTGEKAYAYMESNKKFTQADAPKEKTAVASMPEPIPQVIQMQNPALVLAVAKSAASELTGTFSDIKKVDDTKLGDDGAAYPTLLMTLPNRMVVTMLFNPQTHLLRRAQTDVKPMLEQRGTPEVKNATLTVDYTTVKANDEAKVADAQFAWAPPEGARDQAEVAVAGDAPGGKPQELVGKPAPAFAIKDMEGKTVSLKDLKGKVVVMDLWATWCPPCRASLPHLDKLHEEIKPKGVEVFAVNEQEDKDDVQNFIKQTGLKTPVLLDSDGAVGQAYRAEGIPQTVVIGKDGVVRKVIVGFGGEETAKELKEAVEAAMK